MAWLHSGVPRKSAALRFSHLDEPEGSFLFYQMESARPLETAFNFQLFSTRSAGWFDSITEGRAERILKSIDTSGNQPTAEVVAEIGIDRLFCSLISGISISADDTY